ncbi:MAG: hypothetical protein KME31_03830 [Tolypothrix carrinoi HA7290-LM1]|nr:hypothetical protein [Tolypothrix carrinoi HA7290-LM1]
MSIYGRKGNLTGFVSAINRLERSKPQTAALRDRALSPSRFYIPYLARAVKLITTTHKKSRSTNTLAIFDALLISNSHCVVNIRRICA